MRFGIRAVPHLWRLCQASATKTLPRASRVDRRLLALSLRSPCGYCSPRMTLQGATLPQGIAPVSYSMRGEGVHCGPASALHAPAVSHSAPTAHTNTRARFLLLRSVGCDGLQSPRVAPRRVYCYNLNARRAELSKLPQQRRPNGERRALIEIANIQRSASQLIRPDGPRYCGTGSAWIGDRSRSAVIWPSLSRN